MPEPKVLCVSFDRAVSEGRSLALTESGFNVTATTSIKEALALLSGESFDAVIIGHRFHPEERYVLAVEAEEKLNIPVVLVCGTRSDSEIPASRRVYALEGNAGLLSALEVTHARPVPSGKAA